jgi:hypothetical protein
MGGLLTLPCRRNSIGRSRSGALSRRRCDQSEPLVQIFFHSGFRYLPFASGGNRPNQDRVRFRHVRFSAGRLGQLPPFARVSTRGRVDGDRADFPHLEF